MHACSSLPIWIGLHITTCHGIHWNIIRCEARNTSLIYTPYSLEHNTLIRSIYRVWLRYLPCLPNDNVPVGQEASCRSFRNKQNEHSAWLSLSSTETTIAARAYIHIGHYRKKWKWYFKVSKNYETRSFMLIMMYSIDIQNLKSKHLVSWATQKWQIRIFFVGFKVCIVHYFRFPHLLFFHCLRYKVFGLENVHFYRIHHYLCLIFFHIFLKLYNFQNFQKLAYMCSPSYKMTHSISPCF
jgi:hypothetical protein